MKPTASLARFASIIGALSLITVAHAANLYWDGGVVNIGTNGDGASAGGAGTWSTAISNWDNGAAPHVAWVNANNDTAIFGGTAGAVSLGTNITAGGLTFNTTGYSIAAGNTLTLAGTTPTITTGTGVTATISSIIAGSSGLTKDGAGMLTVTAANTYSGATIINGGTLRLQNGTTFANTSGFTVNSTGTLNIFTNGGTWAVPVKPISLNGGTLSFNATSGTGQYSTGLGLVTVNSASFITVQAGSAAGGNASSFFLDGGLTGSADLTITSNTNGLGVVLRTSATNYSGKLTVNGNASTTYGTASGLAIGGFDATNRPNLTNADIEVNGTLELGVSRVGGLGWGSGPGTGTVAIDALSGTGVVNANFNSASAVSRTLSVGNNNGSGDFSGVIANGGNAAAGAVTIALVKEGNGIQTLSGANTYTGTTTISAGTLSANKLDTIGGNSSLGNATSAVTLGSASTQGTLSYTGNSATYTRGFTTGAGGGRLNVATSGQTLTVGTGDVTGTGLLTVGGAGNTTVTSNLTHAGGLTKVDGGTLTLSGTSNTYTGATIITGGTLALTGTSSINSSSGVSLGTVGTFDVSGRSGGAYTVNNLSGSGTVVGALTVSSTLAIGNSPGTVTFDGNLTLGGGSTSNFEITSDGYEVGTYDLAQGGAGSQTVTFDGVLNLLFNGSENYANNSSVQIFNFENYSGAFDSVTFSGLGAGQTATFNVNTGFVTVVPEPAAALIGGLGLLTLLRRRRN